MIFQFKHSGKNLGTRALGRKLRLELEEALKTNDHVIFDFQDVEFLSYSFADECFGKLLLNRNLEELKKKTSFKNVNTSIKPVIAFVFKERLSSGTD